MLEPDQDGLSFGVGVEGPAAVLAVSGRGWQLVLEGGSAMCRGLHREVGMCVCEQPPRDRLPCKCAVH